MRHHRAGRGFAESKSDPRQSSSPSLQRKPRGSGLLFKILLFVIATVLALFINLERNNGPVHAELAVSASKHDFITASSQSGIAAVSVPESLDVILAQTLETPSVVEKQNATSQGSDADGHVETAHVISNSSTARIRSVHKQGTSHKTGGHRGSQQQAAIISPAVKPLQALESATNGVSQTDEATVDRTEGESDSDSIVASVPGVDDNTDTHFQPAGASARAVDADAIVDSAPNAGGNNTSILQGPVSVEKKAPASLKQNNSTKADSPSPHASSSRSTTPPHASSHRQAGGQAASHSDSRPRPSLPPMCKAHALRQAVDSKGSIVTPVILNTTVQPLFRYNKTIGYTHMVTSVNFGDYVVIAWQAAPNVQPDATGRITWAVEGLQQQTIAWMFSRDKGFSWSEPQEVPLGRKGAVWGPVLHVDKQKDVLWLFYAESNRCLRPTNPPSWEPGGHIKAVILVGGIQGQWLPSRMILPQHKGEWPNVIANRMVELSTGEWLLPFWK
ncbi:hypothetical protein CYMTET_20327, partial [Cymbomonas tetramitiformis]